MFFLFAACVIGGGAKQSAFGPQAKGTEDCNRPLSLEGKAGDELVPVLVLCPGNPVLESFPLRKPVGLSQGGDVAYCTFVLDCQSPRAVGIWTRWRKASSTWFIITWEADLPFTACIASEVQFGVLPLWEPLRQQWLCVCCGSHQEVMEVGGVCGRT